MQNQHIAAAGGFLGCVKILLQHGADLNIEGMCDSLN
jgi:hypothetical protein